MTPEELTELRRELSAQTTVSIRSLFLGLDNYREADAIEFVSRALPILRAGQRTMAQLVAEFLASLAGEATGRPPIPIGIPDALIMDLRQDFPMYEVYRRPFVTIYAEISRGKTLTEAVGKADARLASMVEMDLQQTYSAANAAVMERMPEDVRPDYWRRQLVGSENCAMCVLASTQRYRRADLDPIHPGCDCRVLPILPGEADPLDDQSDELLERAHAAAQELTRTVDRGGRAVDYRKIRTQITARHGEHPAPLLVRPADEFTGPGDVDTTPQA